MARIGSIQATWVAITKAVMVATTPTERSMPPVSMVSVWAAARMASGMANLMVLLIQRSLTMPGWRSSMMMTSPHEQDDERDDGPVAQQPADAHRAESRPDRLGGRLDVLLMSVGSGAPQTARRGRRRP